MHLAAAALVVWIFVWLLVAVRVLRRDDLGAGGKLLPVRLLAWVAHQHPNA